MRRWMMVGLLLLLANVWTARPAAAQPPDDQIGEVAAFLIIFPELRTLPAPAIVQPGTRASYSVSSATIGGGGAGAGIAQYDVAAMDGVQTIFSVANYADVGTGALIPLGTVGKVGLPALGEFWINPTVLAVAEQRALPNLTVTRYTRPLNGQNVQVVRFTSQEQNSEVVWEYSVASGILVFYRQSTIVSGGASTVLSQQTLLNVRTVPLPWATAGAAARTPNWVRQNAALNFSGTKATTIPATGTIQEPYAINTQLTAVSPTWSVTQGEIFVNNVAGGQQLLVSGIGQLFGNYWLPRNALQAQIPNSPTVIDVDPITGFQTLYGRGANGGIVISQVGAAFENTLVYNPVIGSLDAVFQRIQNLVSLTELQLTRTSGDNLEALNALPELPGSGDDNSSNDDQSSPDDDGTPPDDDKPSNDDNSSSQPEVAVYLPVILE